MKPLFITQSVVVGLMGLALLIFPSDTAGLLFGTSPAYPMGLLIGRATGAVLLLWGITCWSWRKQEHYKNPNQLVGIMAFYDIALIVVLLHVRSTESLAGVATWPTVALHLGLAIWCLIRLVSRPRLLRTT
jgi:hypothetical protein